ncbi:MAG: hypothetical protein QMD46_01100 [Methanomicrobiales archaeon]|nr:hypothetical protein [Methanomicrobiales archaeon]MDI6875693.1 hypothetical protein [Methanomicrobiales archaeon]
MDLQQAVRSYSFAERSKSELLIASKLLLALVSFSPKEKEGGRRMIISLMDAIRTEIDFAHNSTGNIEFQKAINHVNEAISLTESGQFGLAAEKVAQSISAVTTVAQAAWQVLDERGLL